MPEVSRFYGIVIKIFYDAARTVDRVGEGKPPPAARQDCSAAVIPNTSRMTFDASGQRPHALDV